MLSLGRQHTSNESHASSVSVLPRRSVNAGRAIPTAVTKVAVRPRQRQWEHSRIVRLERGVALATLFYEESVGLFCDLELPLTPVR
jgi:hypothetical protein